MSILSASSSSSNLHRQLHFSRNSSVKKIPSISSLSNLDLSNPTSRNPSINLTFSDHITKSPITYRRRIPPFLSPSESVSNRLEQIKEKRRNTFNPPSESNNGGIGFLPPINYSRSDSNSTNFASPVSGTMTRRDHFSSTFAKISPREALNKSTSFAPKKMARSRQPSRDVDTKLNNNDNNTSSGITFPGLGTNFGCGSVKLQPRPPVVKPKIEYPQLVSRTRKNLNAVLKTESKQSTDESMVRSWNSGDTNQSPSIKIVPPEAETPSRKHLENCRKLAEISQYLDGVLLEVRKKYSRTSSAEDTSFDNFSSAASVEEDGNVSLQHEEDDDTDKELEKVKSIVEGLKDLSFTN